MAMLKNNNEIGLFGVTQCWCLLQWGVENGRPKVSRPENGTPNVIILKVWNWQTNILHVYSCCSLRIAGPT